MKNRYKKIRELRYIMWLVEFIGLAVFLCGFIQLVVPIFVDVISNIMGNAEELAIFGIASIFRKFVSFILNFGFVILIAKTYYKVMKRYNYRCCFITKQQIYKYIEVNIIKNKGLHEKLEQMHIKITTEACGITFILRYNDLELFSRKFYPNAYENQTYETFVVIHDYVSWEILCWLYLETRKIEIQYYESKTSEKKLNIKKTRESIENDIFETMEKRK